MKKFNDFYDVIVVGAGPAGSVTARYAAENGASVLILERDREPGIPVRCAEGVSHNGIAPFIDIDKRWIATTINTARLHAPDGTFVDMHQNGTGYVLERRIFDTALVEKASEFGATLLTKADVTGLIFENNKICGVKFQYFGKSVEVKCNIVIAADGIESRVGRWAGIDTKLALSDLDTCAQYTLANIDIVKDRCEFYFDKEKCPGGYIWIFPKSDNTANVGLGISGDQAKDKSPKEYLDEFVNKRFPDASITYTVFGGVPTADTLKELVKDNFMVVGDAAHQVNPITGGGIVQVMIAGSLAGKAAAEAVKKNDFRAKVLNKYAKDWNKVLGSNQRFMYLVKEKFFTFKNEKFNNLVRICKSIPPEKFTMKELFKQALKEEPRLLAEMAKSLLVSKIRLK